MKLSQLLSQIKKGFDVGCEPDFIDQITISDIAIDSRLVKKDSVFFALPGKTTNGNKFIISAVENGAKVIVVEKFPAPISNIKDVCFIQAEKIFPLLVDFLKIFYEPLPTNIYGITGTNGKTSTAEFIRQILEFLGKKSASIGSLGVKCNASINGLQNSSLTTPDIVSLYKDLSTLKKNDINDVSIEVSSIGLEQARIAGIKIDIGSFTNFTQDHLDYHPNMEEYFRCKMMLFNQTLSNKSTAILNSDIPEFPAIKKICEEKNHHIIEYGFKARDLRLLEAMPNANGQKVSFEFRNKKYDFELAISGEFQAFNVLCALGNVLAKYDLDDGALKNLLSKFNQLHSAVGRMQRVGALANKAQIFIDSAHTPDALKHVLQLARKLTKARVVALFGCGGDRDAKKRPLMGQLACELSDLVIVTDDNPRSEDAATIRREILAACNMTKTLEITDRKAAIEKAISSLKENDVLILAGKGHEKYQIIGKEKFEFDEEKIVKDVIRKLA